MAAYGLSSAQGISPQDQELPGTVSIADEIAAALKQPAGADKDYTSRILPNSCVRERRPDGLVGDYTLNVQFGGEDTDGRLPSPASVNVVASLTDKIAAAIGGNRTNKGGDACGASRSADDRLSGSDGVEVPATRPLLPKAEEVEDLERTVPRQKISLFFITLLSLLVSVADRLAEPVLEQYVYQVYTDQVYGNASRKVHITRTPCLNTSASHADKLRDEVQDKSADLLMFLEVLAFAIGAVSCLLLGTYSDVMGRRLVLLLPVIGHFLRDVTIPVVIYWDLGLPVLYAGYVVFGITGATAGVLLGCYVYSADVTVSERGRRGALALIMAALGAGSAVMQYAAGLFIQREGFFFPSLTASLCDIVCVLIVIFFLPETIPRDRKRTMTLFESVKRIIGTYLPRDDRQTRVLLPLLLATFLIGVLGDYSSMKLDLLYLMDEPFCWTSSQIGLVGSIKYGVSRVTSLLLLLPLQRVLSGTCLAVLGALSFFACDVLTGLAHSQLLVYIGSGAALATSILYASIRAMMSRMVPADKQGALFGGIAVMENVFFGLSQLTTLSIYKAVVSFMPGIAYFFQAACSCVAIVLLLIYGCLLIT